MLLTRQPFFWGNWSQVRQLLCGAFLFTLLAPDEFARVFIFLRSRSTKASKMVSVGLLYLNRQPHLPPSGHAREMIFSKMLKLIGKLRGHLCLTVRESSKDLESSLAQGMP